MTVLTPSPRIDDTIVLQDGRNLAYAEWGDPDGQPVFLLHGSPDSRLFCPDTYGRVDRTSAECGARLITLDRPGYGKSSARPGLTLLGWVDDLIQLADVLRLERFALTAMSGGGPYGMACGVRIPERITRLGLVSTMAPQDEIPRLGEDDWPERAAVLELVRRDPYLAVDAVQRREAWAVETPEALADPANWPEIDRWAAEDSEIARAFVDEHREAIRQGLTGATWDWIARNAPWGFSTRDVGTETFIWHGDHDEILPLNNFEFLASTIPGAQSRLWKDEGHLAILRGPHWGEVLTTLISGRIDSGRAG